MDLNALAIRLVVCPRCEALPGSRCRTISGRTTTTTHASRTEPVYTAWRDGYGEALSDTLATAEQSADLTGYVRDLRLRIERRAR